MPATITLPDTLADRLQEKAERRNQSLDQVVVEMLADGLAEEEAWPSVEEIAARIQALPPDPTSFHPATASLAELLSNSPADPAFDSDAWDAEWARFEAELKTTSLANAKAEDRG